VDSFFWCCGMVAYVAFDLYKVDWTNVCLDLITLCFKVAQHYYITRRNLGNVGASLSLSNFLTALIDAYYTQGTNETPLYHVALTIYHFNMLISANFLMNVITLISIISFKLIIVNIQSFDVYSIFISVAAIYYVWVLYERTY
jgi:hypothetical protein